MKIYALKAGLLNESERLEIARLLIKAGYAVRLGKEKPHNKNINCYFIEYEEFTGENMNKLIRKMD